MAPEVTDVKPGPSLLEPQEQDSMLEIGQENQEEVEGLVESTKPK